MRLASVLLCLLQLTYLSVAQLSDTTQVLTESDARQHLLRYGAPVYPPIAQAAHVQGDVKIAVVIDAKGNVVSEKIVSGPQMLRQAAVDAVKEWQFKPFESKGIKALASTTLTIPFYLGNHGQEPNVEQEKAAQLWFPLSDKCRNSLKAQNSQDSLDYCKQALDMSLKAGNLTSSDQLAMLNSRQSYGHALLAAGKFQEALAEEDKAIDIAKARLKDSQQEYAMPFYWRAMVEEALGQGDAASADLGIAEETHRKAIQSLPEMKEIYSRYLATMLKQHATLLDRMGRSADAAKLRAEAASL